MQDFKLIVRKPKQHPGGRAYFVHEHTHIWKYSFLGVHCHLMCKLSAQSKLLLCLVTWHEVWTPSDPSFPRSLTTVRHLKVMLGVLLLLPRLISDTCQTCSDVKIFCSHLVLWRWGLQIWSLSRVPWRLPIASRVETLRLPHSEIMIMDDYRGW